MNVEKKKRYLFLLCSQMQLLYAMQIKHTMLTDEDVDIVIMNIKCNVDSLYNIFNNVFVCSNNNKPSNNRALYSLLFPEKALKKWYVNLQLPVYTDVFFWHPSWVYYFLYKCSKIKGYRYVWHLCPEGIGNLMYSVPEIYLKRYGKGLIKKLIAKVDKEIYKYSVDNISNISDIYLLKPQYSITDYPVKIIEIPSFNTNDKGFISIINEVFGYKKLDLHNKLVFIDGCVQGSRTSLYDKEYVDELLVKLGILFGKDRVVLKMHHRANKSLYSEEVKKNINFIELSIPWEIVFINSDLVGCTVVGTSSSALLHPYIMTDCNIKSYIIDNIVNMKIKTSERVDMIIKKIILYSSNNQVYLVDTEKSFFEALLEVC